MQNSLSSDKQQIDETLLKLLPKTAKNDPKAEKLASFLHQITYKKIPTSSFSRMWLLGSLHTKVAAGYLAYWFKSRFADEDKKNNLKNEVHLATALQLFGTMGYLRGAVLKIGQTLANFPELLPDQFAEVLDSLHFEAPAMHYSMIREVFLDEFGAEPEQLFAKFEQKAFAAASLGQVHRATLHTGETVAVKIQYPNIAQTIKNDIRNLRLLLQPLRFTDEWTSLHAKLEDIEKVLLQEADYLQEANFYQQAAEMFQNNEKIVVPKVFTSFTRTCVLTTEYLAGVHLNEFLAQNPSQAQRDDFCHLLTVSSLRPYYQRKWYAADPHSGNFIFMPDGRLGLIDFGCIRVMTDQEWAINCEMEQAFMVNNEAKIEQLLAKASWFDSPKDMPAEHLSLIKHFSLWLLAPWKTKGKVNFGKKEFYLDGMNCFIKLMRKGYTRGAPVYLWSNRSILGYRVMAYRLQGYTDFNTIFQQEFPLRYPS